MQLSSFSHHDKTYKVSYIETLHITAGVTCDVYTFNDDPSRDLAIVHVAKGFATPRQKILLGTTTVEGYYQGAGTLTIESKDGNSKTYSFSDRDTGEVAVELGEIMQWHANVGTDLTFYEICSPPYEDGRFENL